MVHGAWCMVHSTWRIACHSGSWCMVHGAWCMVHDEWRIVHGQEDGQEDGQEGGQEDGQAAAAVQCSAVQCSVTVHGAWCIAHDA